VPDASDPRSSLQGAAEKQFLMEFFSIATSNARILPLMLALLALAAVSYAILVTR
jgi:hypothetical protein